ncbi:MAG: MerR family transcriptional regulator [Rhodocyclaceae bacterium]|nr:MerR family transcriptional regulator [Rhodocyclaceae bacterium]
MNNPPPSAPHHPAHLPIAAVERDTGLSKDTLRVWERRYGFPTPLRDSHGERVYPEDQVTRLRLIRRLLDHGHRPSRVVGNSLTELSALLGHHDGAQTPVDPGRWEALLALLQAHQGLALRSALQQQLLKQGLQGFVRDTVAPLTRAVGDAWMLGKLDVTAEHLYTEQVQNVLRSAIGSLTTTGQSPRILLTTLPGELHGLGLLMVEASLAPESVTCVSLGTQTPIGDIQAATLIGDFQVVALSFSAAFTHRRALAALATLRAKLPDTVEIWAGGQALAGHHGRLTGTRICPTLDEAHGALAAWREAHPTA